MYIWRKSAREDWLRARSEKLMERFGSSLAITERPGNEGALLEISCRTRDQAQKLIREFGGSVEKLSRYWLQDFLKRGQGKPMRIGARLVILSAPASRSDATRPIVIPAEAAFGTGHHATTAMSLRLLERVTRRFAPDWTMLDAGTGSGILALAGRCFGAQRVLAIDNDPLACATARRNARANHVQKIEFVTGDVLKTKLRGKFDVIAANLFSELLIAALPIWSRHLAPNGILILSGILRSQEPSVVRALRRHGFVIPKIRRRGKWIALRAKR